MVLKNELLNRHTVDIEFGSSEKYCGSDIIFLLRCNIQSFVLCVLLLFFSELGMSFMMDICNR